jgi:hypothetical protein
MTSYPQITDMGFMHLVDALSKFNLSTIAMSFGTTETSTTINISDEMVKKLCRLIKNRDELKELDLNLRHRISIGNETVIALKESLMDLRGLTKVHIYLDGTRADPLYTRQLEKMLKTVKKISDVLITV